MANIIKNPLFLLVIILLLAGGLIAWAATDGGAGCPKGQSLQVITYIPVRAGNVTVLQAVYACEAAHG